MRAERIGTLYPELDVSLVVCPRATSYCEKDEQPPVVQLLLLGVSKFSCDANIKAEMLMFVSQMPCE